jgi:hypothetical protein
MSLILNFHSTEISIIEGNPQTLPQIRIDEMLRQQAASTSHHNMQIRDMCSVYSLERFIARAAQFPRIRSEKVELRIVYTTFSYMMQY